MLSGVGLVYQGPGTYSLTAMDPVTIASELQSLVFTPVAGAAGATAEFALTVADHLAAATDYNTAVTITASAPPTIVLAPVDGSNTVNAAAALAGFAINGTTTGVEDGQTVWVLIADSTGSYIDTLSAAVSGGNWATQMSPAGAQALADGSYTIYAYATNLAGITTQVAS